MERVCCSFRRENPTVGGGKLTDEANKQWMEELLNPDIVRTKFVMTGLFMVAHELLEDCIKHPPLSFFADESKDGRPVQSEEYKTEVLKLDPKGKGDARRGSIAWLKQMSAIDDSDEKSIREITNVRNTLAHEMRYIVSGVSEMPELEKWFPKVLDLVTKIERWRFFAIEMQILSDSNGRIPDIHGTLHDLGNEAPFSNSMVAMQALCKVALGDHDEAWVLHHSISGLGSN